jgi:hypothetical protein
METPAQKAAADAAVQKIERAYRDGSALMGAAGPNDFAAANLRALGPRIERWRTVYRRWAGDGHRDDGSAYSWARWSDFGRELMSAIRLQSGVLLSNIAWPTDAIDRALDQFRNLPLPNLADPWPWWVKAGIGAAVVVGVLAVLSPYARFIPGGR